MKLKVQFMIPRNNKICKFYISEVYCLKIKATFLRSYTHEIFNKTCTGKAASTPESNS